MNSGSPNDPVPDSRAHAAATWVLRCDRGLTAAEQDEFSQWLARDPRHGEQLARHRKHWNRLDALAQWRPEHTARPNPDLLAPPRRRLLPFLPATLLLAAAAIALVFFLNRTGSGFSIRPPTNGKLAAAATVTRRVLEDGSVVELNTGAVLTIHFTAEERRVRLEQGEAHFTVTKNTARPFIVAARGMSVHAVGTAFNVRLDSTVVEVLVTEGRVQVSQGGELAFGASPASGAEKPAPLVPLLQAGQRAVVSLTPQSAVPQIATLTRGEIERVLAWQHRMLDFTATPLNDVVAEFNRHNTKQLVVVDPELASIRITGSFRSDNLDAFVRLVEVGFGARAERNSENEIQLRKAR